MLLYRQLAAGMAAESPQQRDPDSYRRVCGGEDLERTAQFLQIRATRIRLKPI